ncbi:hypothetical protein MOKP4_38420 [Mycobacterium avium subsp. hominissuis]
MTNPLGHPDNPLTRRAPLDAVLVAQAFYRDDLPATAVLLGNCDPYSVALQLCGFLFGTLTHFDIDVEERLRIWLDETRRQTGEADV